MIKIKKNKKGFLLGEFTLKIIISVLCLALLIYLLFGLYSLFAGSNSSEEAEATLNSLIEKINSVETEGSYMLLEPESILYYSSAGKENCKSSCLCLEVNTLGPFNKHICKHSDNEIAIKDNEIKFKPASPAEIIIRKEGDKYAIEKKQPK